MRFIDLGSLKKLVSVLPECVKLWLKGVIKLRKKMGKIQIYIPKEKIAEFCNKWKIREFCLFDSILRKEFCSDSDIDVLVTFEEKAKHTLFDLVNMKSELRNIFGRKVDIVSRRGIESSRNYLRKNAILNSAEVVYVA